MQIILASQSPRRRDLLTQMGVTFVTRTSGFDEYLDDSRSPEAVAVELGLGKARAVAAQYPEALVIGSDCIVALGSRQLGKIEDQTTALELFKQYAEQPAKIITSLALINTSRGMEQTAYETAWVHFKPFDEAAVRAYLATEDYLDKAGAFGIQSGALPLIERIDGNYDAIIGLPTHSLAPILNRLGVAAYPVLITKI